MASCDGPTEVCNCMCIGLLLCSMVWEQCYRPGKSWRWCLSRAATYNRPLYQILADSAKDAQEVTVQYNLCNEPWVKYSMASVADRGLKPSQWTSARLFDQVQASVACGREA